MNKFKEKIFAVLLMAALISSLCGCSSPKKYIDTLFGNDEPEKEITINISEMKSVCELATLECYYHNTAKLEKTKDTLWWKTHKKLWVEYTGTVKLGVDLDSIDITVDGTNVTITKPEAKLISCSIDPTSITDDSFYSETKGLLAEEVDADDQTEAFAAAQEGMEETVLADEDLMQQAVDRAEVLMENYVKSIGDSTGTEYKITWVDGSSK